MCRIRFAVATGPTRRFAAKTLRRQVGERRRAFLAEQRRELVLERVVGFVIDFDFVVSERLFQHRADVRDGAVREPVRVAGGARRRPRFRSRGTSGTRSCPDLADGEFDPRQRGAEHELGVRDPSLGEQPAPGLGDPAEPGENERLGAFLFMRSARERTRERTKRPRASAASASAPSPSATPTRATRATWRRTTAAPPLKASGHAGSGCAGSRCGASRTRTPHPRRCFPREISARNSPGSRRCSASRAGAPGATRPRRETRTASPGWNARPANASAAETKRRRRHVSETPYLPLRTRSPSRRREKRRRTLGAEPTRGTEIRARSRRRRRLVSASAYRRRSRDPPSRRERHRSSPLSSWRVHSSNLSACSP